MVPILRCLYLRQYISEYKGKMKHWSTHQAVMYVHLHYKAISKLNITLRGEKSLYNKVSKQATANPLQMWHKVREHLCKTLKTTLQSEIQHSKWRISYSSVNKPDDRTLYLRTKFAKLQNGSKRLLYREETACTWIFPCIFLQGW